MSSALLPIISLTTCPTVWATSAYQVVSGKGYAKLSAEVSGIELDPVLYATKSDDFFHYNVIADEVRNFVNGKDVGREQRMALCQALDTDMSEADTGGEHD